MRRVDNWLQEKLKLGTKKIIKYPMISSLVCILFFIFGIPCFLELLIFRNKVYSPVSNGEWASFFGSFLGSIIGATGILVTLFFNKKENDRMIKNMKEENDRILKENNRISSFQNSQSRIQHMEDSNRFQEDREIMLQENAKLLRNQIRPYFSYEYCINYHNADPNDTILLIDRNVDAQRNGTQYYDFLSLKNVGIHTAIEIEISHYNVKCISENDKKLELLIDSALPYKLKKFVVIEKNNTKDIILPFGINSQEYKSEDYILELVIKFEDVSGYKYYDIVEIKKCQASCIGRYEQNSNFDKDFRKIKK